MPRNTPTPMCHSVIGLMAAVKYDENGNPLMSVIKKNGDYAMNLDFSLVCKKKTTQ